MNEQESHSNSVPEEAPAAAPMEAEDRLLAFADRLRSGSEDQEEEEERPETWVAFRLTNRSFALPVTHVRDFAEVGQITRVPGAPASVCGIASLRGHAIPVVDLEQHLGLSTGSSRKQGRVLVVDHHGRRIGLIVNRVDNVFKLLPSLIKGVPASDNTSGAGRILGFYETDDATLTLLAAETFLDRSEETTA